MFSLKNSSQNLWTYRNYVIPGAVFSLNYFTLLVIFLLVFLFSLWQKSHKCILKAQSSGRWPQMKTGKQEYGTSAGSCVPSTIHPETSGRMGNSRCSFVWVRGKPGTHGDPPNPCKCHHLFIHNKACWTTQSTMLECFPAKQFSCMVALCFLSPPELRVVK